MVQYPFVFLVLLFVSAHIKSACVPPLEDDALLYNETLFPGTHNSAINLGIHTPFRPSDANQGTHPSDAHQAYGYLVMDQRLSILDQLEQGVRVLDFEVAKLDVKWVCNDTAVINASAGCTEHYTLHGRCFSNCPFIVSHGNLEESIGLGQGYTFPGLLFNSISKFVQHNPLEIVTIVLLNTHGNSFPASKALSGLLNTTGLLPFVYNFDSTSGKQILPMDYPTLGTMRQEKQTVMLVTNEGPRWSIAHSNASSITGPTENCVDPATRTTTKCLELWDSITTNDLSPTKAVLDTSNVGGSLFAIPNLSSRRGRNNNVSSYKNFPNLAHDFPYMAGGNPAQACAAANFTHLRALEKRWSELLAPYNKVPNWILVDFFNTTNKGAPKESSRTLLPNTPEGEGLIRAVCDINRERVIQKKKRQQKAMR
jgi:hypothetical protein